MQATVEKDRLLDTLEKNKRTHQADFELAFEGYRETAVKNLQAVLDSVKDPKKVQEITISVNLEKPINHGADYERAIQMLQWETREEIPLTEQEFAQLVQDDWTWKRQFRMSNVYYTGSESPSTVDA